VNPALRRAAALLALLIGVPHGSRGVAQSVAPTEFDVASVKPNTRQTFPVGRVGLLPGGRFIASGATVLELTRAAYGLRDDAPVSGGPGWVSVDRFDLQALAPATATVLDVQAMLKRLLADRFKLAVRSVSTPRPRYVLSIARRDGRLGPLLLRSAATCAPPSVPPEFGPAPPPPPAPPAGAPRPLVPRLPQRCGSLFLPGRISAREITLEWLAIRLADIVHRTVIDRTHLAGTFDLDLSYTPAFQISGSISAPSDGPSIFTALEEQLGLRLLSERGPVEVLIIDHVEHPGPD
jgi:uncharacterized protein (TIGR03435 family)